MAKFYASKSEWYFWSNASKDFADVTLEVSDDFLARYKAARKVFENVTDELTALVEKKGA